MDSVDVKTRDIRELDCLRGLFTYPTPDLFLTCAPAEDC